MPVRKKLLQLLVVGRTLTFVEHEDGFIVQWMADGMEAKDIAALLRHDLSTVARRMGRIRSGQRGIRAGRPSTKP